MRLCLVRHGQTDWNLLGKKQGRTDNPLNETGIKQAEELSKRIKDKEFDICISSPLKRAYKTAEIITRGKCKILIDERLMERNFGGFEGASDEDWDRMTNGADAWDRKLDYGERGMETATEVLARARVMLNVIKKTYPNNYTILIVAHGEFLKAMHFEIVGYDDETDFYSFYFENTAMAEYEV